MPFFGRGSSWKDFNEESVHGPGPSATSPIPAGGSPFRSNAGPPPQQNPSIRYNHAAAANSPGQPAKKKRGCLQCFGMGGGESVGAEERERQATLAAYMNGDDRPINFLMEGVVDRSGRRGRRSISELDRIQEEDPNVCNQTSSFHSKGKTTPPPGEDPRRLSSSPQIPEASAHVQQRQKAAQAVPYKITQPVDEISAEVVFNDLPKHDSNLTLMTSPYNTAMDKSSATLSDNLAVVRGSAVDGDDSISFDVPLSVSARIPGVEKEKGQSLLPSGQSDTARSGTKVDLRAAQAIQGDSMANKPRAVRSLWAPEQSHSPTVTVYQMGAGGTGAGAQPRPGFAPVPKSIATEEAPMHKSLGEWRHSPGGGSVMKGVEGSTSGIIPGAGSSFDASGDADVRHDYPAAQPQAQVPAAAHGHQHHSAAAAAAGQQGESQAVSRPTSSQRGTRASMTSPIPLEPPPYDNLAPPTVDLANAKIRSPNRSPSTSAQRKIISVSRAGDHHHHQQQQQQHVSLASASTQATADGLGEAPTSRFSHKGEGGYIAAQGGAESRPRVGQPGIVYGPVLTNQLRGQQGNLGQGDAGQQPVVSRSFTRSMVGVGAHHQQQQQQQHHQQQQQQPSTISPAGGRGGATAAHVEGSRPLLSPHRSTGTRHPAGGDSKMHVPLETANRQPYATATSPTSQQQQHRSSPPSQNAGANASLVRSIPLVTAAPTTTSAKGTPASTSSSTPTSRGSKGTGGAPLTATPTPSGTAPQQVVGPGQGASGFDASNKRASTKDPAPPLLPASFTAVQTQAAQSQLPTSAADSPRLPTSSSRFGSFVRAGATGAAGAGADGRAGMSEKKSQLLMQFAPEQPPQPVGGGGGGPKAPTPPRRTAGRQFLAVGSVPRSGQDAIHMSEIRLSAQRDSPGRQPPGADSSPRPPPRETLLQGGAAGGGGGAGSPWMQRGKEAGGRGGGEQRGAGGGGQWRRGEVIGGDYVTNYNGDYLLTPSQRESRASEDEDSKETSPEALWELANRSAKESPPPRLHQDAAAIAAAIAAQLPVINGEISPSRESTAMSGAAVGGGGGQLSTPPNAQRPETSPTVPKLSLGWVTQAREQELNPHLRDNNGAGRSQIPQQPKLSAAGAHKDQRNPPRSLGHAHSTEMEAILGSRSIGDSLDYSSSTLSDTTAGSYSPVSMHPEN